MNKFPLKSADFFPAREMFCNMKWSKSLRGSKKKEAEKKDE